MSTTITRPQTDTLRPAAALFGVVVLVHTIDHLRRGFDAAGTDVFLVGSLALVIEIGLVVMVFTRHPQAALAAAVFGLFLAVGYAIVHFTPERSWLSDSFVESGASAVSFTIGMLEIVAALVLGLAGMAALRAARPSRPGG